MSFGGPLGIAASFTKVAFKKDGAVVYETSVITGGCFGPDNNATDTNVVNRAYVALKKDVDQGKVNSAALDFNGVMLRGHDYKTSLIAEKNTHKRVIVLTPKRP